MVSKIEIISKNIEFWLALFSSLNQSKSKVKDKFIRVKSALLISSVKTLLKTSIPKAYEPLNTFSSNYVKNNLKEV